MANESALIIPVGEAEPVVARLRGRHDPLARLGVPAHITLLYPFIPPPLGVDALEALRRLFAAVQAFDFLLTDVRRFSATAYLHPDPPDTFVALTEAIAGRWPEWPPYGGSFSTVVPHLTVADQVSMNVLDHAERELAGQLPIRCRATKVSLFQSDDHARWAPAHAFPLGAGGTSNR